VSQSALVDGPLGRDGAEKVTELAASQLGTKDSRGGQEMASRRKTTSPSRDLTGIRKRIVGPRNRRRENRESWLENLFADSELGEAWNTNEKERLRPTGAKKGNQGVEGGRPPAVFSGSARRRIRSI